MARFSLNSLFYLRRAYKVGAENAKIQSRASINVRNKVADSISGKDDPTIKIGKEVFWMKDPKTGNWIPEDHFDEVDLAELRNKLLSKNRK